jgi:hypothetical protein
MCQDGSLKGYYVLKELATSILREQVVSVKKIYLFNSGDGDGKFLRNVVALYQTTRRQFLEDYNLHIRLLENIRSHNRSLF